jgi:hypothetical protein
MVFHSSDKSRYSGSLLLEKELTLLMIIGGFWLLSYRDPQTVNQTKGVPDVLSSYCAPNTVCSESRCALIKCVGSDVHECLYSKNWIKQLHTLLVVHFNRCLTTEYNETTAHFNSKFNTYNQIYILCLSAQWLSKRTVYWLGQTSKVSCYMVFLS